MPPSPSKNPDLGAEKAARAQLVERVTFLETEIENLKARLNDQSQIEHLVQRIANCENLAGIVNPIKEE